MVTGGYSSGGLTSVELLFLNGTRLCALPDLPEARYQHSQSGLLACGGGGDSERASCVTFSGGSWEQTHTLGQSRYGHTAWASPQGVLLMGGPWENHLTTTELLTDNGGTTLSFNIGKHRFVPKALLGLVSIIQSVPQYWTHFVFIIFSGSRAHTEELFIPIG